MDHPLNPQSDEVRFARIIAELHAIGTFGKTVFDLLCAELELEPEELTRILDRAEAVHAEARKQLLNQPDTLQCPHCGNVDETAFDYFEHILNRRRVARVDEEGVVEIEGYYETDEGCDEGESPFFQCRPCGHRFPVDGIEHEFV